MELIPAVTLVSPPLAIFDISVGTPELIAVAIPAVSIATLNTELTNVPLSKPEPIANAVQPRVFSLL